MKHLDPTVALLGVLLAILATSLSGCTKHLYRPSASFRSNPIATIRPRPLCEGDTVAVCALSNSVTKQLLCAGIDTLRGWGFVVIEADNLYHECDRFAGSDSIRAAGLQQMIDNSAVKAIFMARGGYGAARAVDMIDFSPLVANPKWIVGYSDVTVLHAALNNLGIETIHATMVKEFADSLKDCSRNLSSLKEALAGRIAPITVEVDQYCIAGSASGRLVGGNLSVICSLNGTAYGLDTDHCLLFIEEVGENGYSIDRMLTSLRQCGMLESVAGVVVGDLKDVTDDRGRTKQQIIRDIVRPYHIPLLFGLPAGHDSLNLALRLGAPALLEVGERSATLTF